MIVPDYSYIINLLDKKTCESHECVGGTIIFSNIVHFDMLCLLHTHVYTAI